MTAKIVWFVIFFVVGIIVMKCVEPNEKSGNHISKIGVEIVIGILGTIAASILEPLWTPDDKTIEILEM